MQIPDAEKDQRESYKPSDIDRYTTIKTEGPRYNRGFWSRAAFRFRSERVVTTSNVIHIWPRCLQMYGENSGGKNRILHVSNLVWHSHTCIHVAKYIDKLVPDNTGALYGGHTLVR